MASVSGGCYLRTKNSDKCILAIGYTIRVKEVQLLFRL